MRATTLLRILLGLNHIRVLGFHLEPEGLVVDVAPSWRVPRCSECERKVHSVYDHYKGRRWRHLDLAGMKLLLRYDIQRVSCPRCGVKVELVPWADRGVWFTREFEDMVGFLTQRQDKTTVTRLMRVAWDTVGSIVARVVARHGKEDRLEGLRYIGVDELSYRRHHKYVTVVIDHERGEVVWAHEGKNAETLKAFFEELGSERCGELEAVTIDMSGAYIKAVSEATPEAMIVFDRFHVQRLAHDALDEVRRAEVREAEDEEARKTVKKSRWATQKNPWNLFQSEREKLAEIQVSNKRLYRAYLLKESLLGILDRRQVNVARRKLEDWLSWVSRSRLQPFVKLGRTIRKHKEDILNYIRTGLSNGRTEGMNGKVRTITRRSFGFHSASSLIGHIFLCCSGIELSPVHHYPPSRALAA